jgi:hypothetical protein
MKLHTLTLLAALLLPSVSHAQTLVQLGPEMGFAGSSQVHITDQHLHIDRDVSYGGMLRVATGGTIHLGLTFDILSWKSAHATNRNLVGDLMPTLILDIPLGPTTALYAGVMGGVALNNLNELDSKTDNGNNESGTTAAGVVGIRSLPLYIEGRLQWWWLNNHLTGSHTSVDYHTHQFLVSVGIAG